MKFFLLGLLLLVSACNMNTHVTEVCNAQEPLESYYLMNSMKSGNVEYFLNTWAPANRPLAVEVSNYMPPKNITITKIQWVGSCNNYKGVVSFYVVSLTSDYNIYDSTVTIQTNTNGKVISEE